MIDHNNKRRTIEAQRKAHQKKVRELKEIVRELKCEKYHLLFQRNFYLCLLGLVIIINLLKMFL